MSPKSRRWVIVGAGFTGAVLARLIAERRREKVLVLDRRGHIGGNAHDRRDRQGFWVHDYGAHSFHTNSDVTFNFLSRFTGWRRHEYRALARIDGRLVPVPFNFKSLEALFPAAPAEKLKRELVAAFGSGRRVPVFRLRSSRQPRIRELGAYIYEKVFRNYTLKQWGVPPEALWPDVTARVPVVIGRDERYFRDKHQALPDAGYSGLFSRLLKHDNIEVRLGVDFADFRPEWNGRDLIFTGPIDEFFGRAYGALPYRSTRFEWRSAPYSRMLPACSVHYPQARGYTRVVDYGRMAGHEGSTVQAVEYPEEHKPGHNEPLYPLFTQEARDRYDHYRWRAEEMRGRVRFAGRLADFRYYDMDQAVARAMSLFRGL